MEATVCNVYIFLGLHVVSHMNWKNLQTLYKIYKYYSEKSLINDVELYFDRVVRRYSTLTPCPPGPTLRTLRTTLCPISPTPGSPPMRPPRGGVRIGRRTRFYNRRR